jgi:hypothetical protein
MHITRKELLGFGELENIEFKKSLSLTKEALEALCGMVNTDAGKGVVWFGVGPDGTINGIEPGNLDTAQQSLSRTVREKFDPQIIHSLERYECEGATLIRLSAERTTGVAYHEFDGRAYIREGSTRRRLSIAERVHLKRRRNHKRHSGPLIRVVVIILIVFVALLLFAIHRQNQVFVKSAPSGQPIQSSSSDLKTVAPGPSIMNSQDGTHEKQNVGPHDVEWELATFVLMDRKRYKISGEEINSIDYGLTAFLRVNNRSTEVLRVKALEIVGDVGVDYDDFSSAFLQEGQSMFALEDDYTRKKPFIRLSWISWPNDEGKTEAGDERFIRFVICEPANFGMIAYSGDRRDYFGFLDGSRSPSILTTRPAIKNLVYFTAVSNDRKQMLGPRLRDDVASGKVQFRVRSDSKSVTIPPRAIRPIRLVFKNEWEKSLPQELFFATDNWNRVAPVKRDPLMSTP